MDARLTPLQMVKQKFGQGQMVACKQDPARIDLDLPGNIQRLFSDYHAVYKKYGRVIYGLYLPGEDRAATEEALKAFLDLMFAERGYQPLKVAEADARRIQSVYYSHLFPDCTVEEIAALLKQRKYVILQGPGNRQDPHGQGKIT